MMRWGPCVLAMLSALLQMGCAQAGRAVSPLPGVQASLSAPALRETQTLLIQGYNYTDDYIDSFTVNGQGGGNLFVSGPLSGGGGSVCCVSYTPGSTLPIKLKVRWVGAYCMERIQNPYPYGQPYFDKRRSLWKEADALADDVSQGKPRAMEVHIYPGGYVEAAITQGDSPPRLKLPRTVAYARPGVTNAYPACTAEQLLEMDR